MSELRDPKARERPTEPEVVMPEESALRTPRNADGRDTIVNQPLTPDPPPGAKPEAEAGPPLPAERRSQTGRKAPGETTLVSVPTPADQAELELEDRLAECERKIFGLEERLHVLSARSPGSSEPGWLVWVVFLLALAVAWQLFQGRG